MNNIVDINDQIYCMDVSCWNCSVSFTARIPKGTLFIKWNGKCPGCGCANCFHPVPASPRLPYGDIGMPIGQGQYPLGGQAGLANANEQLFFRQEVRKQQEREKEIAKVNAEKMEYARRMQELDKIDPK